MKKKILLLFMIVASFLVIWGCDSPKESDTKTSDNVKYHEKKDDDLLSELPDFCGEAYVTINNNQPFFAQEERVLTDAFEQYSELDNLGRCGVAYVNVGMEIMPTEERGEIGQIKPAGWHLVKYDIVDGNYLYNRCHLIAYQLTGQNANEKNLITGTRYLNVEGMMPFENMVGDYIEETGNHVLYRVTPIYAGQELLARGVQMEAYSVEDQGEGICFNIFAYNSQPGVEIDYATGESRLMESEKISSGKDDSYESIEYTAIQEESIHNDVQEDGQSNQTESGTTALDETGDGLYQKQDYVLNTNTKKFHFPSCDSVNEMKDKNKELVNGFREDIIARGYAPCKNCNP